MTGLSLRAGYPAEAASGRCVAARQQRHPTLRCRYPEEADAQTLRTAILLDELDFPGAGVPDPRTGTIIVELKTSNATPLLRYTCSKRIIALPTSQLNSRRFACNLRDT